MTKASTLTTDKSVPTDHPSDFYLNPLGCGAVFGCRPEASFMYDGPVDTNMSLWCADVLSTHDSLEKHFVQHPFKIDRNAAPELHIYALIERRRKRMDGTTHPYTAVQLAVPVVYTDSKGVDHSGFYAYEYVSSANAHDQTDIGSWLPAYGQFFGCYKPLANIFVQPDGDDAVDIYVDRCGKRIMSMTFTRGEEMSLGGNPFAGDVRPVTFTLREIPNVNFTAYTERSVCVFEPFVTEPKKLFHAQASIEMANDERYRLGEVENKGISRSYFCIQAITKEEYSDHYVLEQLPVTPPPQTESQRNGTALFPGDTRR